MARRRLPGQGSVYRHVTKRKDGTERERWRFVWEGAVKTFATKREADAYATRKKQERDAGVQADERLTVAGYLEYWLRDVKGIEGVAPTTLSLYRRHIERKVIPRLGGHRLVDLTTPQVQRFLAEINDLYAPATVHSYRAVLMAAFEHARRSRLIAINPVRDTVAPRVRRPRKVAPTVADTVALLALFPDPPWQAVVTIGVCYGLRISEILGLRWRDVGDAVITVTGQLGVNGHGWREQRKVEGDLVFDIVGPVARALARQKAHQAAQKLKAGPAWGKVGVQVGSSGGTKVDDLIFTRDDGRAITQEQAYRAFQQRVKGSGLPFRSPHDLRHANNSLADELGTDLATRMEVLGHRSEAVNRGYSHTNPARRKAALERIARAIGG